MTLIISDLAKLNTPLERAPVTVEPFTLVFVFSTIFFWTSAITFILAEPGATPLISLNVIDVEPSAPLDLVGVVSITPVPNEATILDVFTNVALETLIVSELTSNNCFTIYTVSVVVAPVLKVLTAVCGNLNIKPLLPTSNKLPTLAKSPIKFCVLPDWFTDLTELNTLEPVILISNK